MHGVTLRLGVPNSNRSLIASKSLAELHPADRQPLISSPLSVFAPPQSQSRHMCNHATRRRRAHNNCRLRPFLEGVTERPVTLHKYISYRPPSLSLSPSLPLFLSSKYPNQIGRREYFVASYAIPLKILRLDGFVVESHNLQKVYE